MTDELTTYLDGLIAEVLTAPGYQSLSADDQAAIKTKLTGHFQNMIMETMINRLSEDQVAELERAAADDPDKLTETTERIAATIPGLAIDIEERLKREAANLQKLGTNQE